MPIHQSFEVLGNPNLIPALDDKFVGSTIGLIRTVRTYNIEYSKTNGLETVLYRA